MRHVPKEEGGNGGYITYAINDNFSALDSRVLSLENEPSIVIPSGRKNYLINSNFHVWQRSASQTVSGYGSDDRWKNINSGSTKTHSLQSFSPGQTDVPGNPKFYSRTVVTSVAGSGNFVAKAQSVEDVFSLSGKTATLSFLAKANTNRNIAIEFVQSFGTGGSPSPDVDGIGSRLIALTPTWDKYVLSVSIPSISGKIIGTNNNDALNVIFWFDAGSSFHSRSAALGQQSGTFDIAQVQLEEGDTDSDFERRTVGDELQLCYRYFQKTNSTLLGHCDSAGNPNVFHNTPVVLRASPVFNYSGGVWRGAMMAAITNLSLLSYSGTLVYLYSSQVGAVNTLVSGSNVSITLDSEL